MKKSIVSVYAAVCVVGGAMTALAQNSVTVPWYSSFEGLTNGYSLTNLNNGTSGAWYGDGSAVAVITNPISYKFQAPKVTYPLPAPAFTHTNAVSFHDGGITNFVNGAGQNKVWVDVMLQPVQTDLQTNTIAAAVSNSQMSLCVNTQGQVCVYHSVLTTNGYAIDHQQWTVLNDGYFSSGIASDAWVRLTVTMDYTYQGDPYYYPVNLFQVTVNGHTFTNALAFNDINNPSTSGRTGTWFVCANNAQSVMSQVAFSGSGMFNDVVLTNGQVDIEYLAPTIYATVGINGYFTNGVISPPGAVQLTSSPGTTNFSITANQFYHIASLSNSVDGVLVAAQGQPTWNVPMTVTQDSFINVTFAPDLATKGTPQWWLANYTSFTNAFGQTINIADDTTDIDSDGAKEWQEYVAGTSPVDSNSVLRILAQQVAGTTNTIQWMGTNAALGPYVVWSSANLTNWTPLGTVMKVNGLTNYPAPATTNKMFYRVAITNYLTN